MSHLFEVFVIAVVLALSLRRAAFLLASLRAARSPPLPQALPRVAVLVPAWNESAFAERLLRAFAQLTYPVDKCSFVLVCDGCTDATPALFRSWAGQRSDAVVIELPEHEGKSAALNAGLSMAKADIVVVLDADLRAHPEQPLDVQVDRALPDRAAARERDPRPAVPREERAEHQHRGAHRLDEVVGGLVGREALDAHRRPTVARIVDLRAELLEHPEHRADVAHPREVRELDGVPGQQARGETGERRVLGAPDLDAPREPQASRDPKLVHGGPSRETKRAARIIALGRRRDGAIECADGAARGRRARPARGLRCSIFVSSGRTPKRSPRRSGSAA